jgi:hypothetical protein
VGWLLAEWRKLRPYFALLDFGGPPASRVAWAVRVCVLSFAVVVLIKRIDKTTSPLLNAKPLIAIPTEEIEDYRFRLPERTRREIFAEAAAAEAVERKRAIDQNTWKGHLWSREDDRGHQERMEMRRIAKEYSISLTQAYLVLDEGIRAHWPGPDGKPLAGDTPKLDQRWDTW